MGGSGNATAAGGAARPYTRPVDAEAFAEHLRFPRGRGHVPAGSFRGAAGGAACGDLVRDRRARRGRPRGRRRLRGLGLRRRRRGRLGRRGAGARRARPGRRPRRGARTSPPSSAGSPRASSTRPSWPPTRSTPPWAPPSPPARRVPGGPAAHARGHERRRRLGGGRAARRARGPRGGRGHARAVARPGQRRRGVVLLGPRRPRWPASVAHGMGLPHLTLDLREAFRAGVVDPFLADHAAGLTPNPCVRCNGAVRLDAMVALRRPPRRRRPGHRPLRARHAGRPAARRGRSRQGPELHAGRARAGARCARLRFPLGELTKPEVRALAARRGPARGRQARVPGPVLPRRHRQGRVPGAARAARRPPRGRGRPRRARAAGATAARTTSPSASARGWAWPPPSRSTCSPPTSRPTR